MKIAMGCDHGGYALKEDVKKMLEGKGYGVVDCGTYSTDSCDYPVFGEAAADDCRALAVNRCSEPRRIEYGGRVHEIPPESALRLDPAPGSAPREARWPNP